MKYKTLVFVAACLTFIVVVVGAYVRLQDAGLGCPDWPGCYGHLVGVPEGADQIARAEQGFPDRPVEGHKAWKEMFHRYIAGTLGLLLVTIMVIAWRKRRVLQQSPWLPTAIVLLVGVQATLGKWTVTMLLKPVIVTLHLLGGMATLALISWLALRQREWPAMSPGALRLRSWAAIGLVIVICQIALGGWVSTNYAALICRDFPTCHGAWLPAMDFDHGFHLARELGMTAAGAPLSIEALTAIHWTHRIGALLTLIYIGSFALELIRTGGCARMGAALAMLLALQLCLGLANVLMTLPLPIAVAHNAVAAALLVTMVVINFALSRGGTRPNSV
ncbi:MAG: Cytochrome oxidase subunit [Betaproteobacteria bacterium]|nr:Cytochrome oxidase subunit [Betaproteobacteria bacterium]